MHMYIKLTMVNSSEFKFALFMCMLLILTCTHDYSSLFLSIRPVYTTLSMSYVVVELIFSVHILFLSIPIYFLKYINAAIQVFWFIFATFHSVQLNHSLM